MKKNNKGFSLVELIIVIAIMAVLVAVLAPQYTKYIERSRDQVDNSAAADMATALATAVIDPINETTLATVTSVTITWTGSIGAITVEPTGLTSAITDVVGGETLAVKGKVHQGQVCTIQVTNTAGVWSKPTTAWANAG